jgi:hypothetical protein
MVLNLATRGATVVTIGTLGRWSPPRLASARAFLL